MWTPAVFTDTYLPTVNGVTYTVETWRDRWHRRGGRMPVVYPGDDSYTPGPSEYPVPSVPFSFYDGFRFGFPWIPDGVRSADTDVVHVHTPFTLGIAGLRLARECDLPFVVSYHTPAAEYADYISDTFAGVLRRAAERYERWFFEAADAIVAPSETALEAIDAAETPTHVISNGVDTDRFRPASPEATTAFRRRYGLGEGPLIGYTGRHGYEKRLGRLLSATVGLEVTVVIAGDGPARPELQRRAVARDDVRFLGFLDREELPVFYSTLEAFAFPSPVETQGLVALEAIACGTPVVAAEAGALTETVDDGETGYHFVPDDIAGFRAALSRALTDHERLSECCLESRPRLDVERSIDRLIETYDTVIENSP